MHSELFLMYKKERIPSPVVTTFFKVMFCDEYAKVLFLPPRFSHGVQEKAGKETWLEDSYDGGNIASQGCCFCTYGEKWKVKYTWIIFVTFTYSGTIFASLS
ncbi:hypothetical protein LXL04_017646 [Taraxacum kok-saghyz]